MEKISKIWGTDCEIFHSESASIHYLEIKKGGHSSYHRHNVKRNQFYVLMGEVKIATENGEHILKAGEFLTLLPPIKHRFIGMEESKMLEVVWVQLDDSDIIRDDSGGVDEGKTSGIEVIKHDVREGD